MFQKNGDLQLASVSIARPKRTVNGHAYTLPMLKRLPTFNLPSFTRMVGLAELQYLAVTELRGIYCIVCRKALMMVWFSIAQKLRGDEARSRKQNQGIITLVR